MKQKRQWLEDCVSVTLSSQMYKQSREKVNEIKENKIMLIA